jgi:predicted HTH transcriptional regulator
MSFLPQKVVRCEVWTGGLKKNTIMDDDLVRNIIILLVVRLRRLGFRSGN